MKGKRVHFVPLSTQALDCLEQRHSITGNGDLLFPKRGTSKAPMSNSTILRVMERVGYKGRMTGHGFRSVASSILNESRLFDFDAIERQLAHEDRNEMRAAYNRGRIKWMSWGAHLKSYVETASTKTMKRSESVRVPFAVGFLESLFDMVLNGQ